MSGEEVIAMYMKKFIRASLLGLSLASGACASPEQVETAVNEICYTGVPEPTTQSDDPFYRSFILHGEQGVRGINYFPAPAGRQAFELADAVREAHEEGLSVRVCGVPARDDGQVINATLIVSQAKYGLFRGLKAPLW